MLVKLKDLEAEPRPDILEYVKCLTCSSEISVGDYVCWGVCLDCAEEDFENFSLESEK